MQAFNSPYKVIDTRKYNTWCKYKTRIDTYGCGCQHDCGYCYAKALLNFRGLWDAKSPRVSYITEISERIDMLPLNEVVRIGSMTDCFQPIERYKEITYQTIKMLNRRGIHYLIVTKGGLVSDNKYVEIYDKNLAHFQITITTTDNSRSVEYEKAKPTSERIKSIEKLHRLGFDVSVRLSPFIFQYVDFGMLNNIKCGKILIEFLKVNHWVKKTFDIDYSPYVLKYGGHQNLPLEKKVELVNNVTGFDEVSIGEYVKDHHEYFSNEVNYNPEDCCNLRLMENCFRPEPVQMELL